MNNVKNEIMNLLIKYKHLIDFSEKMEKSNYKFVEQYVSKGLKRNEFQDVGEFLVDAIELAEKWIDIKKQYRLKFNGGIKC